VVYLAEQEEPVRRRLALKIIKLGMDTKQVIARFEAERQALALMDHPNIAKVFDAGATEAGRPFFVMELVSGDKITDYCDDNSLSTEERLRLFIQVCRAVQHAHQKGVIHRDIKPSNILVAPHGDGIPTPKIIDFGIAKATAGQVLTDKTLFTAFEQFIGTPAYMSPEQAGLGSLDVDTRSDIYSLGVLLYELLTGHLPFSPDLLRRAALDEVLRTIREKEPPRPSSRLTTLTVHELTAVAQQRQTEAFKLTHLIRGDLDWIVMKTLEKDRSRRYETASGLARDIERHLATEPVVARPPSTVYLLQKLARRNKVAFGLAGAVAALVIGGLAACSGLLIQKAQALRRVTAAEREQSRLREQAQRAQADEASLRRSAQEQELAARQTAYVSDLSSAYHALEGGNFGLARNLLAAHHPRPGQPDPRTFEWRYLWNLSWGQQRKTLTGHSNLVTCVAYSADGAIVASGGSDQTVKLWHAETGQLIATFAGHSADVAAVAFSPDGRFVASAAEDDLVRLWDVHTRQIVFTVTNRSRCLSFSTNLLAISTGGNKYGVNGGTVELYDYPTGKQVASLPESGNRAVFSRDGRILATANWKGMVQIWDVASRTPIRSTSCSDVTSMSISSDGLKLAWCTDSRNLCVWDLRDEQPVFLEKDASRKMFCVAISPDGQTLATAGATHEILMWNIARREVDKLVGHGHTIFGVAFSSDGKSLASASQDGSVRLWDLRAYRPPNSITDVIIDSFHFVGHPVFSLDSRLLATAQRGGGIQIWNVDTAQSAGRLETDQLPIAFSPNGQGLLTRDSAFGAIAHWDIAAGTQQTNTLLGPVPGYYADAFSPETELIATAHGPRPSRIIVRSAVTGGVLFTIDGLVPARSLAFSRDGRKLAAGHWNGTVDVCDMQSHGTVLTFGGFKDGISCLAFSPDDRLLAVASWDSSIRVFDVAKKKEPTVLNGHKDGVVRVAFSSDGKTLASATSDGVKLWNLATAREVFTLKQPVLDGVVVFSPDGRTLATGGSLDGILHLWRARALEEIEAMEAPTVAR
jgi:WD40 repeat protein